MKGTVSFAITMYPLNYDLLYPLLLYTKAVFIVMCPLNYVKISVVPFATLIFTLCWQNSGENTGVITACLPLSRSTADLALLLWSL